MNKSLKYFGIALLTIIILLLIIPSLIPFENYKGRIADEVKKATGRDLVIAGKISLSLIPVPTVKLHNIKLSSLPQAQIPSLLEVKVITATLAPLKLLTGKIAISFVKLEEPEINLETLADGTNNWEFSKAISYDPTQTSKDSASNPSTLPFEIQRIAIKQGKIQYIKANEKTFIIKDIDIDSHIETLKGPIEFDLSFDFLNQAFDLKGKIQEIGDTIPLTAVLKVLGDNLNLDGIIKPQTSSFAGNITLQGNLKNLKTLAPDIKIPEGLQQDYKFTAHIVADEEKVNIDPIDFTLAALQASGTGNYYIKENKGSLRLNLNPGDIEISVTPQKTQQGEWIASLYIQTQTIKPFVDAIKIDPTIIPTFLNQAFSLSTDGSYQDQNLFLKNIKFALGNAINLKGMVGVKNLGQETPSILYDLSTDNGSSLLSLSGTELPFTITNLLIKGETKKSKDNFSTNTYINTAKFNTHIQGDINVNKAMIPSIQLTSSGDSLGQTLQSLFKTPANRKWGAFSISANLQGDLTKTLKVSLDKSSFALGNNTTTLGAKGALTLNGNKPKISLNLEASSINLDDLVEGTSSISTASQKGADNNLQSAKGAPWSNNKIDLSALNSCDGDLSLSLQKLTQGSLVFDNIKAKMLLQNGVLDISSLTGNFYGGRLDGTAHLSAQGQQALKLNATLKGAELKNISSGHKEIKITQGNFNLSTNLKSEGKTQYQYVNNLSGNINFDASNGHLSGLNLQKTIDALTNIKKIENVLGLLDSSFSGGETVFKSVIGNLIIDKGIANLNEFKLDSGKLTANAKGTINLPKYWMDIVSTIDVDIKNMPPFSVHLYGMLNNPQHKLDTKALSQYIVQNVLTNIIDGVTNGKGRPEDIIKGVIGLGNKKQSGAANNPPIENNSDTQQKKSNPADILIKKGLKELFK